MRVRVVVYNVRGFRDGSERLVRLVGHFRPDVLLLNETGGRWRLRRFATALGMDRAADPWSPFRRRVKDAVLVRPPWRIVGHRQHRFEGGPWLYPRGALVAVLELADSRLCAISMHLGLHPRERLADAKAVAALVDEVDAPIVAGGDLNEKPDGRAVGFLSERFRDAWLLGGDADGETFPADLPTARIDYLFVSDGIVVERVLVPPGSDARQASDHRPLVAELTLPGRE
ncbi:MAG TPA: endonuclease/exonuclease/phosphatase family protein [Actinomycetota bacterium]|nr:endonuclease/exonuclease/phosphatase family protein [Actinomycetota bacterium]